MTLILSVVQQTCGALGYFYTLCKYILVITKVRAMERIQALVAFEINRYFTLTSFYYMAV